MVPRVWGPGVRPSQFPLLKGSPSRRPRARGRACPGVSGGPRRLTGLPPVWGPGAAPAGAGDGHQDRGGGWPAGANGGMRRHRAGYTGACEGGLCGRGGQHTECQEGGGVSGYSAPPGPPPGRLFRAPRWRRRGAPVSVQGGGAAGAGRAGRAAGAPGVAPPSPPPAGAAVTRARLGDSSRGRRGATPREATGRPG